MQFEIHWLDSEMPFVGRNWVFHELHEILLRSQDDTIRGAVIHGNVGTGKSAVLYQLAAHSNSRFEIDRCLYLIFLCKT